MEQLSLFGASAADYLIDSFSAGGFCDDTERKALEARYTPVLEVTDKFDRRSVSYQLSKKDMLHSWLKYKEGFSANLVNMLLDEMGAAAGDLVMDPFMGSGTTALVCQMRGINSMGYDVMPIADVSLKAKASCNDYDISELKRMLEELKSISVPKSYGCLCKRQCALWRRGHTRRFFELVLCGAVRLQDSQGLLPAADEGKQQPADGQVWQSSPAKKHNGLDQVSAHIL